MNATTPPPFHILCAGPYSVAFARLCAEMIHLHCPEAHRPGLRTYIHLDGLKKDAMALAASWLRECPHTSVTCGLFGIRPGERIPGYWHQKMVNKVAEAFAFEPELAIIDADAFLVDDSWWKFPFRADERLGYRTWGLRGKRGFVLGASHHAPINTILFSFRPGFHTAVNRQAFTKDESALKHLQHEFPGLQAELQRGIDSMMAASIRAQLLGFRIDDLKPHIGLCHVGGFSHIKPSKLSAEKEAGRLATWCQRVRLNLRVLNFMDRLGWNTQIDGDYRQNVKKTHHLLVQADLQAPESEDERLFSRIEALGGKLHG